MQECEPSGLELWGGHECTFARIGDRRCDQSTLTGHHARADDIEAFAAIGIKTLRYPMLWERVEPRLGECDWRHCDGPLQRARELGVHVVGGLCHHGAGPDYADLLSPHFAPGLAQHARRAAERYPWIEDWTPVNEPVTTARFSALYGHWHPHLRDERAFWLVLLNQIDAVRLSMRAIREVTPQARLIQTDDLGRTYATPELAAQAAYDNERRWAGWDLLFGRLGPRHPFWTRLCGFGFQERLEAIANDPCPPDVVGINHYLTSDRLLDHRCDAHPGVAPGGNGRRAYVDVEAVRVVDPPPGGLAGAIEEAWARYRAPIAVTEVHNACTRDEQVRWFASAWTAAKRARGRGIDVRAVTAWSLLGAYDWDSLLTQARGHYEPGAFDVSTGERRPTMLAHYLRELSRDSEAECPIGGRGWWERDVRFAHAPVVIGKSRPLLRRRESGGPVLIAGASGTLGQALARACAHRDLSCIVTTRRQMPLDDGAAIAAVLDQVKPRAVINATGFVRVDDAELEADVCRRVNTDAAVKLARACAARNVLSVTFSSDLVFDGQSSAPYLERDATNPLNIYGQSKAAAERQITALSAKALVVRTAAFFSPHDPYNFAAWIVGELRAGRSVECAEDAVVSPTYVPTLANAVLDLVLDEEAGLWHLTNEGAVSWAAFARAIAAATALDAARVVSRPRSSLPWRATRPANSALRSSRGRIMGGLDEAIWRFARDVQQTA